jgi:phytanoyl-CoA hydroxylase
VEKRLEDKEQPMITDADVASYRDSGFIVVEGMLAPSDVVELREVTDRLIARSRAVTVHDDVYDLEPDHTAERPRVRRIKTPHLRHEVFARVARHQGVLAALRRLIGEAISLDTSKLNVKAAGGGAAVEWHQDWAFYPHTNDDLLAVGVAMDDCLMENGPLLCIPGSHKGPVHDHHADGRFCGAIDPGKSGIDFGKAVPLVAPAGSVTIHHARTIHGSAVNRSDRPRRLLLYQYRAADAWPLVQQITFDAWRDQIVCGAADPLTPRCTPVPVRLPLPPPLQQGSIYEIQRSAKTAFFN